MKSHRLVSGRALALALASSLATLAPVTFAADTDLAPALSRM